MIAERLALHRQLGYLLRYPAVSIVVVAVDQVILFVCFGARGWSTTQSNLFAFIVIPVRLSS